MSQRRGRKYLGRIPRRIRTALHHYSKGSFHTPPDLSSFFAVDQMRLLQDAREARVNRLWRILMRSGGVLAAVRWPEYDELIARIRARDSISASKSDPLTVIERGYIAGDVSSLGKYDLCHPTLERASLITKRRVKFVRSSLERGEQGQLIKEDVCLQLLPIIHPRQLQKVQQITKRLDRIPAFDMQGKTRKDQRLRTKQDRCMTSLRRCWQEIFAHPVTLETFQARLQGQVWNNHRFSSRIA